MSATKLWLRCVGGLYLLQALVVGIIRVPIRVLAPAGTLERAAGGEPVARLLVDTWVTLGLEFGTIGACLLLASRAPGQARTLIGAVLAIEVVRGIGTDFYMIARGWRPTEQIAFIVIHSLVIASGLRALRSPGDHLVSALSSSSEMSKSL